MKLKFFAVLVSVVISAPCFSAVVASAAVESDVIEEIIQNYDVLGMDEDGSYILPQDEYEKCVSEILAKIEENETAKQSEFLRSAQSKAVLKSSGTSVAVDVLDEIKNNTRFLQLPGWTGWALDAAEWMIKECLSNPIHAGEEETESETTVPIPTTPTYGQGLSSVAKSSAYYSRSGTTEYFELGFNAMTGEAGVGKFEGYIKRYGRGVTATYRLDLALNSSGDTYAVNVNWSSGTNSANPVDGLPNALYSGYRVTTTVKWTNDSGSQQVNSFGDYIFMYNVNKIPVYTNTNTTAIPLTNFLQNARFSENTFYSNSPTYISNHTIAANTTNYFNSFDLSTAVNNSYISANTEINNNNYQNYTQYGYYIDNDNNINLDADILADYIANVLKAQFEAAYIDFYQRFPEYGVTVGDDDITYYDPFDDGEDETETLPPETIETYPPVVIFPDAEPKYTLDMEAVHSDLDYVKNQASEISVGRSFWIIKMFEKIMTDTGLFPLFFFVFLMGVLGVLLWK